MVSCILRNPQMALNIICKGIQVIDSIIIAGIFNYKITSAYLLGLFLLAVWLDPHPLRFK